MKASTAIIGIAILGIGGYLAYHYFTTGKAKTKVVQKSGYVTVPLFGKQPVLSSIPKGATTQVLQGTGYEAVFGPPQPQYHNIPQIIGVYPI